MKIDKRTSIVVRHIVESYVIITCLRNEKTWWIILNLRNKGDFDKLLNAIRAAGSIKLVEDEND